MLDRYETYANLKFIQIGDNSEIDIGAKQSANIQFNYRPFGAGNGCSKLRRAGFRQHDSQGFDDP